MDDDEDLTELYAEDKELLELTAAVASTSELHNEAIDKARESRKKIRELEEQIWQLRQEQNSYTDFAHNATTQIVSTKKRIDARKAVIKEDRHHQAFTRKVNERIFRMDESVKHLYWYDKAKDYQFTGAKRAALAGRFILGDRMGLGKSLESLMYADYLDTKKLLIITPNDVQATFLNQLKIWAPHRKPIKIGGHKKIARYAMLDFLATQEEFTCIVNYQAWRKDFKLLEKLADCKFDTVILDEAHMLKETNTNAYRGVYKVVYSQNQCNQCGGTPYTDPTDPYKRTACSDCNYIANDYLEFCSIKNVLPMSGTPILNKPEELHSLLTLLHPTEFGDKYQFLYRYCRKKQNGKWVFDGDGVKDLMGRLGSRFLARSREDVGIKLPPRDIKIYSLELDPEEYPGQYKAIEQVKAAQLEILKDEPTIKLVHIFSQITRARQVATWPAGIKIKRSYLAADGNRYEQVLLQLDVHESIKIDKAEELIEEITYGAERVVVFSKFKEPLHELHRRCSDMNLRSVVFDGDTPMDIRDEVKRNFDKSYGEEAKWEVLLANYGVGGVGQTFTEATHTIVLDEEWNPGKRDQAYDRNYRLGQESPTTVHVLRIEDSIDKWMAALIEHKENMTADFDDAYKEEELKGKLLEILTK